MQHHTIVVTVAHFRDLLPLRDALTFLHKQGLIVRIGRQVIAAVLDDQQITVATQTIAGIDHGAGRGGDDWRAGRIHDVDALGIAAIEAADDLSASRPDK